jgi:hypothetical protein
MPSTMTVKDRGGVAIIEIVKKPVKKPIVKYVLAVKA